MKKNEKNAILVGSVFGLIIFIIATSDFWTWFIPKAINFITSPFTIFVLLTSAVIGFSIYFANYKPIDDTHYFDSSKENETKHDSDFIKYKGDYYTKEDIKLANEELKFILQKTRLKQTDIEQLENICSIRHAIYGKKGRKLSEYKMNEAL